MAQKTAWTGAILTEADINTYLMHEGGAWTTYVPVITQSNAPTSTKNYCRWARAGRMIHGTVYMTLTSAGTASNGVSVSLPVAAVQNFIVIGSGRIYDTSAGISYPGIVAVSSSTSQFILLPAATNDAGTALGALNFTAALATGDEIHATFCYEAAS